MAMMMGLVASPINSLTVRALPLRLGGNAFWGLMQDVSPAS